MLYRPTKFELLEVLIVLLAFLTLVTFWFGKDADREGFRDSQNNDGELSEPQLDEESVGPGVLAAIPSRDVRRNTPRVGHFVKAAQN